jgi:FKBP-type peptidyl-prolyl cis-trans isomerase FkpA/FKBP-type peptidyl-prolyl cis-trans isomerase FklB
LARRDLAALRCEMMGPSQVTLAQEKTSMRQVVACSLVLVLAGTIPARAAGPELTTEEQKTLYALGLAVGQRLAPFSLTEKELELVEAGLADSVLDKEPKVDLKKYAPLITPLQNSRLSAAAEVEKKAGDAYREKAAAAAGANKTASGLIITTIKPGEGESPKATDKVKVHYTGTLTDGTVFDSSVERNEPAVFPLNGVIPCWTEGLQLMKVGGKSKLVCPSNIAYGDRGRPPKIKPGATLVFDIELLEIEK